MIKKTIIIASWLFFTAAVCGWAYDGGTVGSDSSSSTSTSSTSTSSTSSSSTSSSQPAEKTRVVAFGDSITAGYGAVPYSVYLQQMLDSNNCNSTVINQGSRGESTVGGVNRIGKVLANYAPHYILIMEGANDARIGISASATVNNLGAMMDKAGAAGAIPIVSNITPNTESGSENRAIPDEYNPGIANAASTRSVRLVDNYSALAGNNWGSYTFDGLHMTVSGQQVLASQFFNALPCGGGSSSGSGGGGGGCFIATAAYGSLLESHVVLLRRFRDSYLMTNTMGQKFVQLYYKYSPPLAAFISNHDAVRAVVRVLLIPLIVVAYLLVNGMGYLIPVGFIMFALLAVKFIKRRRLKFS